MTWTDESSRELGYQLSGGLIGAIGLSLAFVLGWSFVQITRPGDLGGITVPERRWIMPDWLPVGHTTGLYGDGGTGKSLLSQQLMTHAAVGRPFLGIDVEHVRSFGVFCEDCVDGEGFRDEQETVVTPIEDHA